MNGFAAAPGDSLVEISTTDVYFQHERAEHLSWFIFALYAGSDLEPVASGFIVKTMSWRWCFYFQVIFVGVVLVVQLFYMEDTTFTRMQSVPKDDSFGGSSENYLLVSPNKEGPRIREKNKCRTNDIEISPQSDDDSIDHSIMLRTYWQRMKVVELEFRDPRSWIIIFYKPLTLVTFPAVIWGGIIYGSQIMWLSLLATTQSEIYADDPYNFSADKVV